MPTTNPKKYILRFAAANKKTFDAIKSGAKTVETRAGTLRYLPIKAGDVLVCVCGTNRLEKTVKKVTHVKSISALLKKYDPGVINPGVTDLKGMEKMYYSYPGYKEKIEQYGILAFELSQP